MMSINKYTIGVFLGVLIILFLCLNIAYFGKWLYNFEHETPEEKARHEVFVVIDIFISYFMVAVSVCAIVATGLLIAGILKRNSKLLIPWLCCSIVGIICQCLTIILQFYLLPGFFPLLIAQLLLFWFMYKLYTDMEHVPKDFSADNSQPMINCGQPNYV